MSAYCLLLVKMDFHIWIVVIGILSLIAAPVAETTRNPGVKLRLSQSGLNYVEQIALNVLDRHIRGVRLPDVRKDRWEFFNIEVGID